MQLTSHPVADSCQPSADVPSTLGSACSPFPTPAERSAWPSSGAPHAGDRTFDQDLLASVTPGAFERLAPEEAVDCIVNECFFAVGQAVGRAKALDAEAVRWWRLHYRSRFLQAMARFGNRWTLDRDKVAGVGRLLAVRAMRYAGDSPSISVQAARQASADVEQYCTLHSRRLARSLGADPGSDDTPWIAGYWCLPLIGESGGR
jgi:hypothetical protein